MLVGAAILAGCGGHGGGAASGGRPQAAPAPRRGPTTYYVNAARGRDSASGRRPRAAWRTLARVDRSTYRGGDEILLRGGERFEGTIRLGTSNLAATSRAEPLTIGSYGRGRATIRAPRGRDGLTAVNVAGVRISRIDLVGRGDQGCRERDARRWGDGAAGIRFEARRLNGTLADGIAVDRVDVGGFCDGIVVASGDDGSRISHVRVAAVTSHDNREAGVWTYDQSHSRYSIRDVTVTHTRAYRNAGRGGIALFGVDRGTVEDSIASANAREEGGGVGIWAFDSRRILLSHDEAYGNGSASIGNDGDGFDLDRGVSNSVIEHSYSHGNGGVGFLVCSCAHWGRYYRMHDDTVRSSVSRNDGSSGQPSLYVLGGEPMARINVLSDRVESGRGRGPLVQVGSYGRRYVGLHLRENTFIAEHGKRLLQLDPARAKDLVVEGNRWRAIGGRFSIRWGHRLLDTRRDWRATASARG